MFDIIDHQAVVKKADEAIDKGDEDTVNTLLLLLAGVLANKGESPFLRLGLFHSLIITFN